MYINSQPLFYCFKFSWGIQTLSVSGRYSTSSKAFINDNWKNYRLLSSLNNAEITKKIIQGHENTFYRRKLVFNQLRYRFAKLKD